MKSRQQKGASKPKPSRHARMINLLRNAGMPEKRSSMSSVLTTLVVATYSQYCRPRIHQPHGQIGVFPQDMKDPLKVQASVFCARLLRHVQHSPERGWHAASPSCESHGGTEGAPFRWAPMTHVPGLGICCSRVAVSSNTRFFLLMTQTRNMGLSFWSCLFCCGFTGTPGSSDVLRREQVHHVSLC